MKNFIIIGLFLVTYSLSANANPVDGIVDSNGISDNSLQDNSDSTESQIESPNNAGLDHHDEVVIDTNVDSVLNDSLVESEPPLESTKVESCLTDISKKLNGIQVPNKVEHLANIIRSLNANLPSQHLTDLIVDRRASLDVHNAGFFKEDEMDLYVQECSEFVGSFLEIVGDSECGENFMNIISPHNGKNYKSIMEKHDDVDKMVGYTEACFIL